MNLVEVFLELFVEVICLFNGRRTFEVDRKNKDETLLKDVVKCLFEFLNKVILGINIGIRSLISERSFNNYPHLI
jgi:hypothetical protein